MAHTHDSIAHRDVSALTSPSALRSRLRHRVARTVATAAMGAWILLAVTPVVVVICAIR